MGDFDPLSGGIWPFWGQISPFLCPKSPKLVQISKTKLAGMPERPPSRALSALFCAQSRPGLRKRRLKIAGSHFRTKPRSPHRNFGLGNTCFWPLSRSLRPLDLIYFFCRKRQGYAISHSAGLFIFWRRISPIRPCGRAQLRTGREKRVERNWTRIDGTLAPTRM